MIPDNVKQIMQKLLDYGFEAYVVGGAVRDFHLGIEPKDYDIFTNATGEQILSVFPHGKVIGGEERQAKILTVIVDGVEVSQYRSNGDRTATGRDLKQHCGTCDFTINSIAMDINGNIFDYWEGMYDIKRKVLWFVGDAEQRAREDPLRIFRGIRLASRYNLEILDGGNSVPFLVFPEYVSGLPKERIRDELMKIIPLDGGFEMLNSYGMLEWIIPEFKRCQHLYGGKYHDEPVDIHLVMSLNTARTLTTNPLLLLTTFFHDIGKPESAVEADGDISFHDHETFGVNYVRKWMKEYKFSENEIRYVTTIIKYHNDAHKVPELSGKHFARICNELRANGVAPEDISVQAYSDSQANLKRPRLAYNEFLKENGFLRRYYELLYSRRGFNPNDLEVTGKDIINAGFPEGRQIGEIKTLLFEKVCDGTIVNRRDRLLEELQMIRKQKGA